MSLSSSAKVMLLAMATEASMVFANMEEKIYHHTTINISHSIVLSCMKAHKFFESHFSHLSM